MTRQRLPSRRNRTHPAEPLQIDPPHPARTITRPRQSRPPETQPRLAAERRNPLRRRHRVAQHPPRRHRQDRSLPLPGLADESGAGAARPGARQRPHPSPGGPGADGADDGRRDPGGARQVADSPTPFTGGQPERMIVWEEEGVLCRALIDWLHDDHATIDDLKTTAASAHYRDWTRRTMWTIGAAIQARSTGAASRPSTVSSRSSGSSLSRTRRPYALSVVDLSPAAVALADAQIDQGFKGSRHVSLAATGPPIRAWSRRRSRPDGWKPTGWREESSYDPSRSGPRSAERAAPDRPGRRHRQRQNLLRDGDRERPRPR